MVTDNVDNPLERGMMHTCPKCKSSEVLLEPPETLTLKFAPAPSSNKTTDAGSRYYRIKCGNCKLSTKNHTNPVLACDEWVGFVKKYEVNDG